MKVTTIKEVTIVLDNKEIEEFKKLLYYSRNLISGAIPTEENKKLFKYTEVILNHLSSP